MKACAHLVEFEECVQGTDKGVGWGGMIGDLQPRVETLGL